MPEHRNPYVGEGADGARRSAQIDREEADTLPTGPHQEGWSEAVEERRAQIAASAERWERQAESLAAAAASQVLTVISMDGEFEVHKAGCAHLKFTNKSMRRGDAEWSMSATSRQQVANDAWSDFKTEWEADGLSFESEALGFTHFAPCVELA